MICGHTDCSQQFLRSVFQKHMHVVQRDCTKLRKHVGFGIIYK